MKRVFVTRCAVAAVFCLGMVVSGCNSDDPSPNGNGNGQAGDPASAGTDGGLPELSGEVKLASADWATIRQEVESHRGKVVVLQFWANWMREEFPNVLEGLVTLQRSHPDEVVCISVNVDEEPDEDQIRQFLERQGARFSNYLSDTPQEELLEQAGAPAVPAVLVYDPEGELRKVFHNEDAEYGDSGFSFSEHVAPLVQELEASK